MSRTSPVAILPAGFAVVLAALISAGCDRATPTEPEWTLPLPDFDCREVYRCALTCSDRTTGGIPPYVLYWQADLQPPTTVINPTFIWSFDELTLVRVRLTVTDDDGRGESRGPVEKSFEICGAEIGEGHQRIFRPPPWAPNAVPERVSGRRPICVQRTGLREGPSSTPPR